MPYGYTYAKNVKIRRDINMTENQAKQIQSMILGP